KRALAGDDDVVVERVHVAQALGSFETTRLVLCLVEAFAAEEDVGAMVPRVRHLHERRTFGHHDGGAYAQPAAMVGDGLRVIARAGGDDALLSLVLGEKEELVQRPALLERAGVLEVLELEEATSPGGSGEGFAFPDRRELDVGADAGA